MSEKEWEKFFDLMAKIIDMPGMSANEKIAEFRDQAKAFDANLDEFASYFPTE